MAKGILARHSKRRVGQVHCQSQMFLRATRPRQSLSVNNAKVAISPGRRLAQRGLALSAQGHHSRGSIKTRLAPTWSVSRKSINQWPMPTPKVILGSNLCQSVSGRRKVNAKFRFYQSVTPNLNRAGLNQFSYTITSPISEQRLFFVDTVKQNGVRKFWHHAFSYRISNSGTERRAPK